MAQKLLANGEACGGGKWAIVLGASEGLSK